MLRLEEFRQSINSAVGQTDADNELLTHIPSKAVANRIINYFKTNYSIKYLKGRPSNLDPAWRPIIYSYSHKVHLLNSNHKILSLTSIKENVPDINQHQYDHLCDLLQDYTHRIGNRPLSKIKPDFVTESLKFKIKKA